jgi:hypothetical protein
MLLKGSQRGGGQNLASHLMKMDDNEHVRLHELRGFASDGLHGAFKEIEAVSLGTRCSQYLFSLSLSPPQAAKVSEKDFELAVDRIERRLGLEGQPRAIVFHEKENRLHAHAVWSRIDAETMTAKQMSYFKTKLMGISRDLYLENGWKMPRGLENSAERNPTNFSLAEWQQAKRQGMEPRWLKQAVQDCWNRTDDRRSFEHALNERGLFLAKGDQRGAVILDHGGDVWSLPRLLDRKPKEIRARLDGGPPMPSVAKTRETIGDRMTPAIRRHVAEARERFVERSMQLGDRKEAMTREHRAARAELDARQKTEWDKRTRERFERLPKGIRGLWHRLTGRYQEVRALNEAEALRDRDRQAAERQKLVEEQRGLRAALQTQFQELRKQQAEQLLELRKDVGRFLKFTRGQNAEGRKADAALDTSMNLNLVR